MAAARDRKIGVHSCILHIVHGPACDVAVAISRKDARRVNACRPARACVSGAAEYVGGVVRESAEGEWTAGLLFRLADFERAGTGV